MQRNLLIVIVSTDESFSHREEKCESLLNHLNSVMNSTEVQTDDNTYGI